MFCRYAIKQALKAGEHSQEPIDTAIFFMDIRSDGKDFEKYYQRAKDEGVRFIRCRMHSVDQVPRGAWGCAILKKTGAC